MSISYHYDDCPYFCNPNGMILDSASGKLVPCPHCSAKRKELLRKGLAVEENTGDTVNLSSLLGVQSKYLSDKFVYDTVIPEGERLFMDKASIEWQKEEAEKLYNSLVLGELPTSSMCFGIGIKGRFDRFAYPMLAKAYKSGLTVGKFTSSYSFSRMVLKQDSELDSMYTCDFLMMMLNEGSTQADMSNATGLMIARAINGKPTVFVTNWTIESCSGLLWFKDRGDGEDEDILNLAKPVFVKYGAGRNVIKPSPYVAQILREELPDKYEEPDTSINGNRGMANSFFDTSGDDYGPIGGVSIRDL